MATASNTVNIADLKQKAKLPARQAGGSTVKEFFEANKSAMAAVLPKHVSPERMLRLALTAVRSVPQLMECTTESLMGAVMQCAQLGVEPNTPLGHAYMIPFRNRKANRTDVQVIVGYRGLIDLARRSGQIISLAAHAVYEKDEFDFAYGLDERLHHVPARGDRGEIVAFYAVARLKDGGHQFEVMWREAVDRIRESSQGAWTYRSGQRVPKESSPWWTHYEEMGRKTVIRRLAKYLPLSIEMATAVAMDEMVDTGRDQNLDQVLTGEWSVVQDTAQDTEAHEEDGEHVKSTDPAKTYPMQDEEGRWFDAAGEVYDPDRHGWSRENNRPSVTADGRFRARRRSRGEAEEHQSHKQAVDGNQPTAPEDDQGTKEWLDGYDSASDLE